MNQSIAYKNITIFTKCQLPISSVGVLKDASKMLVSWPCSRNVVDKKFKKKSEPYLVMVHTFQIFFRFLNLKSGPNENKNLLKNKKYGNMTLKKSLYCEISFVQR